MGKYVSEGFGVISCWVIPKLDIKLTKLFRSFWVNSAYLEALEGCAEMAGVVCWMVNSGSTEMPICAMWQNCWIPKCCGNKPSTGRGFFIEAILKMADGLALEM